ncbi:MAG: hypothetical protein OEY51_12355 [Cyclobacteriaceae bacterium]|nr:hypothetical protein [Cyclobacteriaceae bacterium]
MYRIAVFVFTILFPVGVRATDSDSIKRLLSSHLPVEQKISTLNALAFEYRLTNYLLAREYGENAIVLSVETGDEEGEAKARYTLGLNYWLHGFYPEAFKEFFKARQLFSRLGISARVAAVSNNLGLLHLYRANYDSSLYYLKTSFGQFTTLKDTSWMANLSKNIAIIYDHLGEFQEATKHNIQALEFNLTLHSARDFVHRDASNDAIKLSKHLKDQHLPVVSRSFLASLAWSDSIKAAEDAQNLGTLYLLENEYDTAIQFFDMAAKIYSRLGEPDLYVLQWVDISRCFKGKGQMDSSIFYLNKAIPVLVDRYMYATADDAFLELGRMLWAKGDDSRAEELFKRGMSMADTLYHPASSIRYRLAMAELCMSKDQLKEAFSFVENAYTRATRIRNFELIMQCTRKLYEINKRLKHYTEALHFQDEYLMLSEKKRVALSERSILELQVNYESELKTRQITQLNALNARKTFELQQSRLYLFIIAVVLLVLVILAGFLINRIRLVNSLTGFLQEKNALLDHGNKEKDLLIQEIHHRVKNNLQLISSMLNMQIRRTREAETKNILELTQNRVKSIALIHEHLYQKDEVTRVNFKEYIVELTHYLKQSFEFSGSVPDIKLEMDPIDIHMDLAIQLGMILNELIVNSFKYAFNGQEDPVLTITGRYTYPKLLIVVKDNGRHDQSFVPGYGWSIVQNTIQNLNGKVTLKTDNGFETMIEIHEYFLKDDTH